MVPYVRFARMPAARIFDVVKHQVFLSISLVSPINSAYAVIKNIRRKPMKIADSPSLIGRRAV
jgi:hypothetical protein